VRLAVDAERTLVEMESWELASKADLRASLDLDAAASRAGVVGSGPNADYVRALRGGGTSGPQHRGPELELLLPEEVAARWRRDAAEAQLSLGEWVERLLDQASSDPVPWEIAATAAFQPLSEWCYASALRRLAIRTA